MARTRERGRLALIPGRAADMYDERLQIILCELHHLILEREQGVAE